MILFITSIYLAILLGAEALYRHTRIPTEWTRKLQHLLSGGLAACFPWIFASPKQVALLGAMMGVALLFFRKSRFLSSLHEVKRKTFGEFYFLLSAVLLSLFSWENPAFYFISMLTLTCSDTVAAIVGSSYQRITYAIRGHVKSVEGSAAFFISTFLTVHLPLLFLAGTPALPSVLIALATALLVTLIEALCRNGRDNILIPLSTWLLLLHFHGAPVTKLLAELTAASAITITLMTYLVCKRRRRLANRSR